MNIQWASLKKKEPSFGEQLANKILKDISEMIGSKIKQKELIE